MIWWLGVMRLCVCVRVTANTRFKLKRIWPSFWDTFSFLFIIIIIVASNVLVFISRSKRVACLDPATGVHYTSGRCMCRFESHGHCTRSRQRLIPPQQLHHIVGFPWFYFNVALAHSWLRFTLSTYVRSPRLMLRQCMNDKNVWVTIPPKCVRMESRNATREVNGDADA